MARNLVTRTIISTKVTALCLNVLTAEPYNETFNLPGTFKDTNKLKKVLEKTYNNDERVIAHIVSKEEISTLYGMSEEKFMANAEVLPERKSKNDAAES